MNKISIFLLGILLIAGCQAVVQSDGSNNDHGSTVIDKPELPRFKSEQALLKAFEDAQNRGSGSRGFLKTLGAVAEVAQLESADAAVAPATDFSETNVQVQGVDEADIIKTDGTYIYTLGKGNLVIARAYPADRAEILTTLDLDNFRPREMFIEGDRLLLFGENNYNYRDPKPIPFPKPGRPVESDVAVAEIVADERIYPPSFGFSTMSVRLYDISARDDPKLLRTVDFEGNYVTARKIDDIAYFVVNSWPRYAIAETSSGIIPLYREGGTDVNPKLEDFESIADATEIGYIHPIQAANFITVASLSLSDVNQKIEREVIVGSGQNVYASLDNLYVAQTTWPRYNNVGKIVASSSELTVVTRFELDDGEIEFDGVGEAPGHILNQFSMDEKGDYFRIATTKGQAWATNEKSTNNMYVLDDEMEIVGKVEGIAPGESIFSVRFMGDRAYMVTFKQVDPLFVIDLSDPENPEILGKLKIPGFSDYLHPFDENHLIGVGKEVDESIDADKIHSEDAVYYTAIQGVKLALFDVSDVENPIELYKEVIGDRGSDSLVSRDHKAFLFDRARNLVVLPVTVAELKPSQPKSQEGDFVYQGAYVYDLTLDDGFELRGRVTHYDDDEVFKRSGFYFDERAEIMRSLYIGDVLYTLSNERLQLNDLDDLDRLDVLEFEGKDLPGYPEVIY